MDVVGERSALDTLRAFVARNRGRYPLTESFPQTALRSLRREECDGTVVPLLLDLVRMARSYEYVTADGRNAYEGDDLRNLASVVEAIGSIGRAEEEVIDVLRLTLAEHHRESYSAAPGSPDPDKLDRDGAVERAEDFLAESIVCTLACLGEAATPAAREVEQAERHRSPDVQYVARSLATRLCRRSITVSGSIPPEPDGEPGESGA